MGMTKILLTCDKFSMFNTQFSLYLQVYNALGVSCVRDWKLGDACEQKKDFKSALNASEEVLLFYPNNKVAQPRRDALKEQVKLYGDVPVKTKER